VLDTLGLERAVLAGASMGAHTAVRFALSHPERVAALGLITPSFDPDPCRLTGGLRRVGRVGAGLREGGVEGFVDAYDFSELPAEWRGTVETVVRQRLAAHEHPRAVADALEVVPRSRPFEDISRARGHRGADARRGQPRRGRPGSSARRGRSATRARSRARQLVVEDAGPPARSPIAWQGGQLSKVLIELAAGLLGKQKRV
jgi:pimeloyl-ACP methyl ester carboxylesterase